MSRLTRSRNELQDFEFPDLGINFELNKMTADDNSVNSSNAGSVGPGGAVGGAGVGGAGVGGARPARTPEKWCENPMYGDFNPGTLTGETFFPRRQKAWQMTRSSKF